MKILRVAGIPNGRNGGMARYIHFVSNQLREAGHEVDHAFAAELDGGRTISPKLGRFVSPLRVVRVVSERMQAGHRYDVVEVHEPIAAAYTLRRRWRPDRYPPLVVSVYAAEQRSLDTRLAYSKLRGESVSLKQRLAPLTVVWQANFSLRNADHITVETTEDRDFLCTRLKVPLHRITMHPGGVQPEYLFDSHTPRTGVLFVGTWLARKGVHDLVRAMTGVLDRRPNESLTVAGAGVPDDRVRNDFPERVRNRIRVVPATEDDLQLASLYRRHSVFAFPSTFEGMPLALLEAAASGLAIVTTPTCGMRDLIVDGQNGVLVPVGDAKALATAVDGLLSNPEKARRLGNAARESVRSCTWKRAADAFLAACNSAISRPRWGRAQ